MRIIDADGHVAEGESLAIEGATTRLPTPSREHCGADLDHRPPGLGELGSGALCHRKRIRAPVR